MPTDADIAYSHLVDDTERSRTAALRAATDVDRTIAQLRHAIANGRTDAALDLLTTIDGRNRAILAAVTR